MYRESIVNRRVSVTKVNPDYTIAELTNRIINLPHDSRKHETHSCRPIRIFIYSVDMNKNLPAYMPARTPYASRFLE